MLILINSSNADIESLIRKIYGYAINPEKPWTTKIGEHIPCGYSRSTIWGFDYIENKHTLCFYATKIRIKMTSRHACYMISMLYLRKKNL